MDAPNEDGAEAINVDEGADEDDYGDNEDDEDDNARTLRELEDDDSILQELYVPVDESDVGVPDPDSYRPSSTEEWTRTANGIGNHTHLHTLCFMAENMTEEQTKILFRGVAENKSIRRVSFEGSKKMAEEQVQVIFRYLAKNKTIQTLSFESPHVSRGVLRILAPFFQNNRNFEELYFISCDIESANSLTSTLSEFSSLKQFGLSRCDFGNEQLIQLIVALSGHLDLENLRLGGPRIEKNAGAALAALLRNSESRIVRLDLGGASISNDEAITLAAGLDGNSKLKELGLDRVQDITEVGWVAIFTALTSQHCSIEELSVYSNQIHDIAATSLAALLGTSGSLITLELGMMSQITAVGWREIFAALQSNDTLKLLKLCHCDFGNAVDALIAALGSYASALESLHVTNTSINDATAISLASSLLSNKNLIKLYLRCNNITINGWSAFSKALCDTSSIMRTFKSNHKLRSVYSYPIPESLESLLRLNGEHSDRQAARLKIIQTHFPKGFATPPFLDMASGVLPHAIAWMTRYNESGTLDEAFYGFLRGTASWIDRAGTQERN